MEKHVTSLEISKKLKELGVKQESEFYRVYTDLKLGLVSLFPHNWEIPTEEGRWTLRDEALNPTGWEKVCSAFLASELGELLPKEIERKYHHKFWLQVETMSDFKGWACQYKNMKECYHFTEAGNMVDAMGEMLIYLLENKLIQL